MNPNLNALKYRCTHCNHTFELESQAFKRCPNCFWTTSVVPLSEGNLGTGLEPAAVSQEPLVSSAVRPASEKKDRRKVVWKTIFIPLAVLGLAGAAAFVWFSGRVSSKGFSIQLPAPAADPSKTELSPASKPSKTLQKAQEALTAEERAVLREEFRVTIPRQLSEDEEEILKKQVSSALEPANLPPLSVWTKEEFQKLIESEQKKRKILLGWSYNRRLVKVFETHYLAAAKALEAGDRRSSRDSFIRSLAFPVYRNDALRFRSVVLVMLRPFVNDVLGKIAVVNQNLLSQSVRTETQAIFKSYQELFPVLELHEWDQALQRIEQIRAEITAFETKAKDAALADYPPAFGELDAELQRAIRNEATPQPDAAVSFKALLIDLDLKEKASRQNTPESLSNSQKQFDRALRLIGENNFDSAREELRAIEHPQELVEAAKKKLAVISKLLALTDDSSSFDSKKR